MRSIVRACSTALFTLGIAVFVWISYDATAVLQLLGTQTSLDEAGVALAGFTVSILLVAIGVLSWRRSGTLGAA